MKTPKQKTSTVVQDFNKKGKVSVWVSDVPYADIPDEYFEESYSRNNTRATNQWTKNFKMKFFDPKMLETNGAEVETISLELAVKACSCSNSFLQPLLSKARKRKVAEITWVVLLFNYEYSMNLSGVGKDEYLKFVGAFDFDIDAD